MSAAIILYCPKKSIKEMQLKFQFESRDVTLSQRTQQKRCDCVHKCACRWRGQRFEVFWRRPREETRSKNQAVNCNLRLNAGRLQVQGEAVWNNSPPTHPPPTQRALRRKMQLLTSIHPFDVSRGAFYSLARGVIDTPFALSHSATLLYN